MKFGELQASSERDAGFFHAPIGPGSRGVKKLEQAFWPVNSEVASSTASQFSVEIEFRQSGAG